MGSRSDSCVSRTGMRIGRSVFIRWRGTLKLSAEIRSEITTRAGDLTSDPTLRDKCVVYIETSRGLIRKFKGLDNIPELISLKSGKYLAEAWTGDSVSALFWK